MGDEHGLVVLLLVLRDHAERERTGEQAGAAERGRVHQVEHPAPDLMGVGAGLGRWQQRQRRPCRARMLEGVVEGVDLRAHRVPPAHLPKQPEFLLVGDVREVPHQR